MPIREYVCRSCGEKLERLQRLSDDPLTDCPNCGEAALEKKISAVGFRLAGGGWYETDFKSDHRRNISGNNDSPADGAQAQAQAAGNGQSSGSGSGSADGNGAAKAGGGEQSSQGGGAASKNRAGDKKTAKESGAGKGEGAGSKSGTESKTGSTAKST